MISFGSGSEGRRRQPHQLYCILIANVPTGMVRICSRPEGPLRVDGTAGQSVETRINVIIGYDVGSDEQSSSEFNPPAQPWTNTAGCTCTGE